MKHTDRLDRATFHTIAERADITPLPRDIRWFQHLERHGPLSSKQLIAWTADTHRCRDTALRRLQALRAARYLILPPQQRATERAEFKPYIYDLGLLAQRHLREAGLSEPVIRPGGPWWHIYETASFTARIDLACRDRGYRFILGHEILARSSATLAISIDRQKLIPDQLFAIDYGGRFRAFMLEIDRGTEPIASPQTRKSWTSALELYERVFKGGYANQHYGLKAPVIVLWQLSTEARLRAFEGVLERKGLVRARRYWAGVGGSGGQGHRLMAAILDSDLR
ncbi:MAG: replication-relaxation family protein [Pseudomonadota bacterium]